MKPLVKNAADEGQVRDAASKELRGRERELKDIRSVMSTAEGRRLIWRLLVHCRCFASVADPIDKIQYNAGQQDVGHFLLAEVDESAPDLYDLMKKESKGVRDV